MKEKGTGSKWSPIAIDDSEEEVIQELFHTSFESNPSPRTPTYSPAQPRGRPLSEIASPTSSKLPMRYHLEGGEDPEGKRGQKRKRVWDDSQSDSVPGPSRQRQGVTISEPHLPSAASKKARKRQRKLERQMMETESHSKRQIGIHTSRYLSSDEPTFFSSLPWSATGTGYGRVQQSLHSLSENAPFHEELPPTFSSYSTSNHRTNGLEKPTTSTSAWVSSMAMAAATPIHPRIDHHPHLSEWPPPLPLETMLIPVPTVPPIPYTPLGSRKSRQGAVSEPAPSPLLLSLPSKPVHATIGMKPDQDPSSKHGLFQIPVTSTTSAGNTEATLYIPNPARTLVMEQLPKTHRTSAFVNSWSKLACGAHPVYVSIDAPAAKALIEFATAKLARKAWGSPKLGTAFAGLKSHQLKGRPREDLIKVWWYRVDGIGAGAGVGEIEEGEIEGDAGEKEVDVPVKKETKKERKARLAMERQAKQDKLPKAKLPAASVEPQAIPPQSTAQVDEQISTVPSALPPLALLPPRLNPRSHSEYVGFYPTLRPTPAPPLSSLSSLPHRPLPYQPPLSSRIPLLPQSALGTQWREKRMLFTKEDPIPYATSTFQNSHVTNESLASSVTSSRSPSPAELSTRYQEAFPGTPKQTTDYPTHEDHDMDYEDDMELESPEITRRSYFDISLPFPKNQIEKEISTPVSPTPITPTPQIVHYTAFTEPHTVAPVAIPAVKPFTPDPSRFATPPSSIASPAPSATPPLAPSEPRAMKNAPKGPSYAKRSLLARHKDLEERIARSKVELGILTKGPLVPLEGFIATNLPHASQVTPGKNQDNSDSEKQAMEKRLRTLVLQSQKNKSMNMVLASPPTNAPDHLPPSPSPPLVSSTSSSTTISPVLTDSTSAPPSVSSTSPHTFSLDDLAVSFITETIQTYKSTPLLSARPPTPPAPKPPSRANTKLDELAAKQKRLEQHISESKVLMARLTQARTKQEKDSILTVIRERSRIMEEETQAANQGPPNLAINDIANGNNSPQPKSSKSSMPQGSMKWPVSHHDAGVLVVSDDEEDESSDDDMV